MKINEIVRFNGQLGTIVDDYDNKDIFKFLPVNYGRNFSKDLETITEETIEPASFEDKLLYLKKGFNWGKIIKIQAIGDYQIIEYISCSSGKGEPSFHSYVDFKDTNHSYNTLEQALIGVIAHRFDGVNSRAAGYFCKMIGI